MGIDLSTNPLRARSLLGYLWDHRGTLWRYMAWRLLSVTLIVPFPILTQRIIDRALPAGSTELTLSYLGIGAVLLALHAGAMFAAVGELTTGVQQMMCALRARIFQKINFMSFRFLDANRSGKMLSKYAYDTNNVEGTLIPIITSLLPEVYRTALLTIALAWINPWLLVFSAVCIPVFALVRALTFGGMERANREVRLAFEEMTGRATELISAIRLVRSFGEEEKARGMMESASGAYSARRRGQMRVNQTLGYSIWSVFTLMELAAVGFGALMVIGGHLSVGAVVALVGAVPILLNPVNMLANFALQYFTGQESYRSMKELADSVYVEAWNGSRELPDFRGKIEFRGVRFRYEEGKPLALDGLDFTVEPGEHVALVGPSGSGKSTVVQLLLGMYAPTEGEIRIDGVPQWDLAMRWLRQRCAIVLQDNVLLSGTLLDNVRFGRPGASEKDVLEAARAANAWDFIEKLPGGLMTTVGERGVSLSGGERQRIAIARALLRDPRILVLDEATSALDYESERLVQDALRRLARGRTTLTIAHRLGTVRHADRLLVLRAGRIAEEGTYEDLCRREGGMLRKLLAAQTYS